MKWLEEISEEKLFLLCISACVVVISLCTAAYYIAALFAPNGVVR